MAYHLLLMKKLMILPVVLVSCGGDPDTCSAIESGEDRVVVGF